LAAYRKILAAVGKPGSPSQGSGLIDDVVELRRSGTAVGIVVGGGNLLRGAVFAREGLIDRATADNIGMLGTVMNALFLEGILEQRGVDARVLSAIHVDALVEPYTQKSARHHLDSGHVLILAGGTGNPYLTTDTAAALRAAELGAEVLLKATKVDGVYSSDPKSDPGARRFDRLSYAEVLDRQLAVMDAAAVSICRDNGIPIIVFDGTRPGNLRSVVNGETLGTFVGRGDRDE
jgi:uridylate kinase